jgi:hypothetical protein
METEPLLPRFQIRGRLVGHILFNRKGEQVTTCDLPCGYKGDNPDHFCVLIIRDEDVFYIVVKRWINCFCSDGIKFRNIEMSSVAGHGWIVKNINYVTLKKAIYRLFFSSKALIALE